MGSCTAQCKMLLFCANTVVRESAKFELARLKEEEEEGGGGGGGDIKHAWFILMRYLPLYEIP